ncbi:transcriptional repressor TCF25-domain-containing protein [Mycena pura]|uniref:Transcriptional repressor TCF25-domain-containing protein n=1 Tax=Mycena pura TaxID=153505 RepID=A0AAD6V6E7_9AGAR|nr:transcriptional repressor TCF25-domain-containing protein [Mycena pura]
MPPRLNKRQQRELDELEALGGVPKSHDYSSEGEEEAPPGKTANSGFALFATEGAEQDSDDDEGPVVAQKSRKKKKKKRPADPASAAAPGSQTPATSELPRTTVPAVKNEKKAAKKAKARERKADNDDFDQALAALSIKYPELQNVANQSREGARVSTSLASLLSVSVANLDSEAEMRKFFGARVVQANKSGASGSSRRQTTQRSYLTRPPATWFRAAPREGLSLRALTDDEIDVKAARHSWDRSQDEKWWTVEYSKKYKSVTLAFMTVVYSGDPNGFHGLLQQFPWHGDTLLQLAEVYRHREDYSQAVEFVDRALFSYERAFVGSFSFTTGLNRLDFDRIENRPFFLALHRQATDLQRRGCVRTAFEFARLLLSLDPFNDPHGALLHLDFLAVKTGMGSWLLDMFDLYSARRYQPETKDARADPSVLPGWMYARALAIRIRDKSKDNAAGSAALIEAIRSFPSVVPLLADKLDVSLPDSIRSHRDFQIETDARNLRAPEALLHLLSHLYAQRSFSLWKGEVTWFTNTVTAEFSSIPASLPVALRRQDFLTLYQNVNLRYSVYRHVMVLETSYRRLFSYIPQDVLSAKSLQCDPLSPPTAVTSYDDTFFEGTEDLRTFAPRLSTRQRAQQGRVLAQMIPNADLREQLQAFWNAMPAVQERFPEGVVQFAEAAAQMDPEELEALMLLAAMGDEGAAEQGGMPGQMPGMAAWGEEIPEPQERNREEEEAGVDDEDDDEDEPLPIRVLRNVFGRFWGGNVPAEESSSEEEPDGEPRDTAGVD